MKKQIALLLIFIAGIGQILNAQNYVENPISAEVFLTVNNVNRFLHGIVFDYEGNMIVGKDNFILLRISPDKKVSEFAIVPSSQRTRKTHIWNMDIGSDSAIYAAAGDRIYKVKNGTVSTLFSVDVVGYYGALDLRFDNQGNFYFVSDSRVYKCDSLLNKTVFIDSSGYFSEGTSLCFNKDFSKLYISDPPSKSIIEYPIANGIAGEPVVITSMWPHYIDVGENNTVVCTPADTNGVYILDNNRGKLFFTKQRVLGCTLKFGRGNFGEHSAYVLDFPNVIYKIDMASLVTDVINESPYIPKYSLEQNYPNPFNPVTTIGFQIPNPGMVNLRIFDLLGREVYIVVNKEMTAGRHEFQFDGSMIASGIYYYKINVNDFNATKKLVLIK